MLTVLCVPSLCEQLSHWTKGWSWCFLPKEAQLKMGVPTCLMKISRRRDWPKGLYLRLKRSKRWNVFLSACMSSVSTFRSYLSQSTHPRSSALDPPLVCVLVDEALGAAVPSTVLSRCLYQDCGRSCSPPTNLTSHVIKVPRKMVILKVPGSFRQLNLDSKIIKSTSCFPFSFTGLDFCRSLIYPQALLCVVSHIQKHRESMRSNCWPEAVRQGHISSTQTWLQAISSNTRSPAAMESACSGINGSAQEVHGSMRWYQLVCPHPYKKRLQCIKGNQRALTRWVWGTRRPL